MIPFLLPLLLLAACGDTPAPDTAGGAVRSDTSGVVPYRFTSPDAVVRIPAVELRELSGLTVLASGRLGGVQDEVGTIFEIDPASGEITGRETFRARGDFEGVERVGDTVWALESNGDLYRLRRARGGTDEATHFVTELASRNDAEGLAYDPVGNRLLIACKENPGNGLESNVRAVYAFDLATETLSDAPVFTLDRTRLDTDRPFRPSAIAVRPGTGEIYVLSSGRKAIAVLTPDGALRAVVDLPDALVPQPEGLAFLADGTLFLSNEGPRGPATLLRFDPLDR